RVNGRSGFRRAPGRSDSNHSEGHAMTKRANRRRFLQSAAAAGFWVAAGLERAESRSPNEKLNIAIIGAGGRGASNAADVAGENIVALCDVDEQRLGQAAEKHRRAKKYIDFRKLYDDDKSFDAVVVSTTEHTHALATMPALRAGKHVYCEKPLAHSVWETRLVTEAAIKAKVATQMGTQIHATDNYRRVVELIQSSAIGPVRECHVWVSRDWGGGDRPKGTPPTPEHLHWDLWLGPAPERPYHPAYVPGPKWYKYWDFGGGTLPDLGSHWNDLPFWALKLRHPTTIEAEGPPVNPETAPGSCTVRYQFPARGDLPAVNLTWYQGTDKPKLLGERKLPRWSDGVLFIGDEGMLLADYGKYVLLPESKFADFKRPEPSIPRSMGHHAEWVHACKTGKPTTCPFEYSGVLTESNLLGNVAYRVGKKLEWDPVHLKAKNCTEAERYIHPEYRKGWSLPT
ncbi:MAG TPA: Gfo/Idh/MocA family oxidoreductase, partial [Gemmataceae bacterium]|nr:Gfo/Idh/MocA family oxidoreductase [Gemmataceae bacterium]